MKIATKIPMINSFKLCLYGVFISLFILSCGASTTGTNPSNVTNSSGTQYTVTFDLNGGTGNAPAQDIVSGGMATKPADPTSNGYAFTGWYKDSQLATEFNFDSETITANITLYAKWTQQQATTYTVTFVLNGGTGNAPAQEIVSGGMASKPTDPTRTGHTFAGWYTSQTPADTDTEFNFQNTAITEAINLYAKWTRNTYVVTFDFNYDNAPTASTERTDATGKVTQANPTRTSFNFVGWYTNAAGEGTVVDLDTQEFLVDTTIYAKWTTKFTVNFVVDGGSAINPLEVDSGASISRPADPTRRGHTFENWYKNQGLTQIFDFGRETITANTSIYAKWTRNTYTVTFDLNYTGSPTATTETTDDTGKVTQANPTRTGYTFVGWYTNGGGTGRVVELDTQEFLVDTTLYAKWTRNTYTVTFDLNYAGSATAPTAETDDTGKVTQANPTRRGYTFVGWYTNGGGTGTVVDLDTQEFLVDTTLYAKWTRNTYTVTFDLNYDNAPTANTEATDDTGKVTQVNPTRTGYTFVGWYTNGGGTGTVVELDTQEFLVDTTLYAKWTRNTYTVTFDLNYVGSATAPTAETDTTGKVAQAKPTRTGYTFVGWYTNGGGTGTVVDLDTQEFLVDTTLYAKWTRNIYTVTFNLNYANAPVATTERTDDTGKVTQANPTRTGYTFVGWYTNGGGTGTVVNLDTREFLVDTTLYAKWTRNTYTVTFDLNYVGSATAPTAETDTTGKVAQANPTRTSFNFVGWYTNAAGTGTVVELDTQEFLVNTTLYAKWTRNIYTVTFNLNYANAPVATTERTDDTGKVTQANPTRTGYTFVGWYINGGGTGTVVNLDTREFLVDTTLYAKWTRNTYTVTFDLNYVGSATAPTAETDTTGKVAQANPTRTGYTFVGWYTNGGGTGTVVELDTQEFLVDTTLYAKWTTKFTVNFVVDGGSAINPLEVDSGASVSRPADPTRRGHTFDNWYKDQALKQLFDFGSETITANTRIYAKWTRNTYTVTFDLNYDNAPTVNTEATDDTGKVTQANPTRTGYTFVGWYTNGGGTGTVVDLDTQEFLVDTTLYAKWTRNIYTVTFNLNYANAPVATTERTDDTGKVTQANPTRTGYTFVGWYTNGGGTGTVVDLDTREFLVDTTLYAKWIATYTVTFDMDSATPQAPQTINHGTTATEPTDPTREGYTFNGWFSDPGKTIPFSFDTAITSDTTIYVKWTRTYTVSFDANGGTGAASSVSVMAGSTFSFPTPPTRASTTVGGTTTTYYFGGWYTGQQDKDQHGRTKHKASTPVTNDLTLYARWYTEQPDKAALVAIITAATADADLNHIDVRQVIDLANLFRYNTNFNGAISRWDVSEVTSMKGMFGGERGSAFNGELNNWDTGNVRDMSRMFVKTSFNQDIGGWNTGNVRDMSGMFWQAPSFNKDIGEWNTGNVRDMSFMFSSAYSFNKDIGGWNTGNVRTMEWMFFFARSFNQDLTKWLNTANPATGNMFTGATAMTAANKACWMPAPVPLPVSRKSPVD